jgi:hypothetical protein
LVPFPGHGLFSFVRQVDEFGVEDRADSIVGEEAALTSQLSRAESRLNDLSRLQQDSDV